MRLHYDRDGIAVYHGDALDVLANLDAGSVDSVVTDPPYLLGFMGREWDTRAAHEHLDWHAAWCAEAYRVLKPGGHVLAFGGTRTFHRLACAVEDSGFEIRDCLAWIYGSGFPKSLDVSKAIDKAAGAEREAIGSGHYASRRPRGIRQGSTFADDNYEWGAGHEVTAPATDAARQWSGWGTALKPAHEPIIVGRKPLVGSVAANVLAHGTGALNVDGCRLGSEERTYQSSAAPGGNGVRLHGGDGRDADNARRYAEQSKQRPPTTVAGRWPANVALDEAAAAELDRQSGDGVSRIGKPRGADAGEGWGMTATGNEYADSGGASRFFYIAKAPSGERPRVDGIAHPTVKPLELMRWLVRLVTPPRGLVLDPFTGSGTTVEACLLEGFGCLAVERESEYLSLIDSRIARRRDPVRAVELAGGDGGLFDLLDNDESEGTP